MENEASWPEWSALVKAVRQHKPSELLPALANESYRLGEKAFHPLKNHYSQWAFAGLARESMQYGTEFRSKKITSKAMARMLYLYQVADSIEGVPQEEKYLMVGSYQYEQYKFQLSMFSEIARTYLLFCDPELQVDPIKAPQRDWTEIFGMSLEDRLQAVVTISAAMLVVAGKLRKDELSVLEEHPGYSDVRLSQLMQTLDDLTTTVEGSRELASRVPGLPEHLKRFALNPLTRYPIVDIGGGILVAPQPFYLMHTLSVGNLYYRGLEAWKNFSTELGYRVEAYVGKQLEYAQFEKVLPEIDYGTKSPVLSVDWFAIFDDTVLLIECKNAKISQPALSGDPGKTYELLEKSIDKARGQLRKSSELVLNQHAKFRAIPKQLKQLGLIVTTEPIHSANDSMFTGNLQNPGIPCLAISLGDLERLTALGAEKMIQVISKVIDAPTWSVHNDINEHLPEEGTQTNQILADAYEKFYSDLL